MYTIAELAPINVTIYNHPFIPLSSTTIVIATEEELNSHQRPSPVKTLNIKKTDIPIFIHLRGMLLHNSPTQYTDCPYCPQHPHHTILHCLNTCLYAPLKQLRASSLNQLPPQTTNPFPFTKTTLLQALGGTHWSNSPQNLHNLQTILQITKTSHILTPQHILRPNNTSLPHNFFIPPTTPLNPQS